MKGAKGVIVSITGGEDMRLMEVDEAASHIKELVDPDANIIWGSAFNNDLEGRIRVSVVATGIEAEPGTQAEPAKVFAFQPTAARRPDATPAPAPAASPPSPTTLAAVAPSAPAPAPAPAPSPVSSYVPTPVAAAPAPAPTPAPVEEEEELLLSPAAMLAPAPARAADPVEDAPRAIRPGAARDGDTLFERMSKIARGAAKAQVDGEAARPGQAPLDLPSFLSQTK
jgi:cell division protein FtsZ